VGQIFRLETPAYSNSKVQLGQVIALGLSQDDGGWCLASLLVEPAMRVALGRIVPADLARVDGDVIRLRMSPATFESLPLGEDSDRVAVTPTAYALYTHRTRLSRLAVKAKFPKGQWGITAPLPIAGPFGARSWPRGVVCGPDGRVEELLIRGHRFIGRRTVSVPVEALVVKQGSLRLNT
jgi:hypothetical protein